MSRPLSPDRIAATSYGLTTKASIGTVQRAGGAAKLATLDQSAIAVLIAPAKGDSRTNRIGGLAARGMGQRGKTPLTTLREEQIEREIQRILRERGLIKP